MPAMTYLQAISAALRDELRSDERVLLMGEDIGVFGGAFKVTDGFVDEFGTDRVMDTPLAESNWVTPHQTVSCGTIREQVADDYCADKLGVSTKASQ